jgi:hypothetical protein
MAVLMLSAQPSEESSANNIAVRSIDATQFSR